VKSAGDPSFLLMGDAGKLCNLLIVLLLFVTIPSKK
jgi:hypothetical protein